MALATFSKFINTALKHTSLIIDLCAESDFVNHSKLLYYLGRYNVLPFEKDALIETLCEASILFEETENVYTINPVVVELVNYYERRGRLTSATFLRDQIFSIATSTDELQRYLAEEEPAQEMIVDIINNLYFLVREIRESGDSHYMACMRILGDIKRSSEEKTISQRLDDIETLQRRHILPLSELIDPSAEFAHKIISLKRRMTELNLQSDLLANSQELDTFRRRLEIDLRYIDYTLLRNFKYVSETTFGIIQSLLEEKKIKNAVALCLSKLDKFWNYIQEKSVLIPAQRFSQFPDLDSFAEFFNEVLQYKFLPNPTPLSIAPVQKQMADALLISKIVIWKCIEEQKSILSWPQFVIDTFHEYTNKEQLKAIAVPLIILHPKITVKRSERNFCYSFREFNLKMNDFSVFWRENDGISEPT